MLGSRIVSVWWIAAAIAWSACAAEVLETAPTDLEVEEEAATLKLALPRDNPCFVTSCGFGLRCVVEEGEARCVPGPALAP